MNLKNILLFYGLLLVPFLLRAEVKLPGIFTDNMVLQRDVPINIWGWADKNETIVIHFLNQKRLTKADESGKWMIRLDPTAYGGPYQMEIKGERDRISLKNILVGEVWLASGQSNMEWTVSNSKDALDEISQANYPEIRSFNVEKTISTVPQQDLKGQWQVCSSSTAGDFSAVAYYFARKLYRELGIPVGIINSSWGGTGIETWTSPESFNKLPAHFNEHYKDSKIDNLEEFMKENEKKKLAYYQALNQDVGRSEKWEQSTTDLSLWKMMKVPQLWEEQLGAVDGIVWFKRNIQLPKTLSGKTATLHLGPIDDDDVTWINGIKVGETNGHMVNRHYTVPVDVLTEGVNTITVRITDSYGGGGFYGDASHMFLEVEGEVYPLSGEWLFKESVTNKQFGFTDITPNAQPSLLYNAMINPIVQFPIRGVIWYQGENNAGQAYDYRTLFPNLIQDWRSQWNNEFPFYWVQLANYMAKDETPEDSDWANLRDAQTRTLSLAHTGQAVITDIGEAEDIHPRNKQEVGRRLALIALAKDYGKKDLTYAGPTFKSLEKEGNKLVVTFESTDDKLTVANKYGYVEGFAIAGADKKFVWAKAHIEGNKIIVYADGIADPVFVRYAWSNNPDVNLFNKSGLPAVPFSNE